MRTFTSIQVLYHVMTAGFFHFPLPYSGNFRGRKLSQILKFCGYSRKFSLQNLGVWHLWCCKTSNLRMFSPRKSYFSPIRESFLSRKFPAIRYSPLSRLPTFLNIYWYLCMWGLKLAPADKHAVPTRHGQAHPPRRAAVYGSIYFGCLTGPRMLCVWCNEWLIVLLLICIHIFSYAVQYFHQL